MTPNDMTETRCHQATQTHNPGVPAAHRLSQLQAPEPDFQALSAPFIDLIYLPLKVG